MSGLDVARLSRALQRHAEDIYHPEAYSDEGRVVSCDRYCGPDIAERYADPTLMELTDAEQAAEDATWD